MFLCLYVCVGQYSVVRIVREKMLRTEAFTDAEQLQAFLSQLYVFLVDEMHKALNKVRISISKVTPTKHIRAVLELLPLNSLFI